MTAISPPLQSARLGSALATLLLGPQTDDEVAREVFDVQKGGRLMLDATAASVNVSARDVDVVEVRVEPRGMLACPALVMVQEGRDVYVECQDVPMLDWLPVWARRIHIEVSVPAEYSVDVETQRGRVRIEGTRGQVEARTRDGRLCFRNIEGPIEARTARGAIEVEGCTGDVDLVATSGSIGVDAVAGSVSAYSRDGRLEVRDSRGDLELQSRGGPIHVEGARGNVIAHSRGGSVSVSYDEGFDPA